MAEPDKEEKPTYVPPEGYTQVLDANGEPELAISRFPIIEDSDGTRKVDVDGQLIHQTAVVDVSNHEAMTNLARKFRNRFFKDAISGIDYRGDVDQTREKYEKEEDPFRKETLRGLLVGTLLNSITTGMHEYVTRKAAGEDGPELEVIAAKAMKHMGDGLKLIQEGMLLKGNVRDTDEILYAEFGEAPKAFMAVIGSSNTGESAFNTLYQGRYLRIADAFREIDEVGKTTKEALDFYPELEEITRRQGGNRRSAQEVVDIFTDSAKRLIETSRRADPELYLEAYTDFNESKKLLDAVSRPGDRLQQPLPKALGHLKRALDEVSAMVTYKMGTPNRVNAFVAIKEIGHISAMANGLMREAGDSIFARDSFRALRDLDNAAKDIVKEPFHVLPEDFYGGKKIRPFNEQRFDKAATKLQAVKDRQGMSLLMKKGSPGDVAAEFIDDAIEAMKKIQELVREGVEERFNTGNIRAKREQIREIVAPLAERYEEAMQNRGIGPAG